MFNPNSKSYRILVVICSIVITAAIGYLIVWAGSLTPSDTPGDTMYTLDDIYYRLDKDASATSSWGLDPSAVPTGTMYTLEDIFNKTPDFHDNPGDASTSNVRINKKFYTDSSTKLTGAIPDCSDGDSNCYVASGKRYASECTDSITGTRTNCYVNTTVKYVSSDACSTSSNTGYCYINTATFSAMDSDLVASYIMAGVTIFGITGNLLPPPECTDDDAIGTTCGGGIKFATGLVAMPGGCDDSTNEPSCSGTDWVTKKFADATGYDEPADSLTDGEANTTNLVDTAPPANPAAQHCFDMVYQGYSDWYLPAANQLDSLCLEETSVGGFATTTWYLCSTEDTTTYARGERMYACSGYSSHWKTNEQFVRCIRSY